MSSVPASFELGWFWSTEAWATSLKQRSECLKAAHINFSREFQGMHGGANRLSYSSGALSPPFDGFGAHSNGPRRAIGLAIL